MWSVYPKGRESVLSCAKWERYDQGSREEPKGNAQYIESLKLNHFLAICKANKVKTIWQACQRWPRLLSTTPFRNVDDSLFPEAVFEQNRHDVYHKHKGDWAVSQAVLARAFGLPDAASVIITSFAKENPVFQAWTTELHGMAAKTLVERHKCPSKTVCWLRAQLKDSPCEYKPDEMELYSAKCFQQACVHTPIAAWIRLYERAVNRNIIRENGVYSSWEDTHE
jgi:hypothetical protein